MRRLYNKSKKLDTFIFVLWKQTVNQSRSSSNRKTEEPQTNRMHQPRLARNCVLSISKRQRFSSLNLHHFSSNNESPTFINSTRCFSTSASLLVLPQKERRSRVFLFFFPFPNIRFRYIKFTRCAAITIFLVNFIMDDLN